MGKGIRLTSDEREMLRKEYEKAWNSKRMVDYCIDDASGYWQASDGTIEVFRKPSIETEFWFGENAVTADEWSNHWENIRECSKSERYFLAENMRRFDCKMRLDYLDEGRFKPYVHRGAYCGQTADCRLGEVMLCTLDGAEKQRRLGYDLRELTADEVAGYRAALENQVDLFSARLKTYLKRYGLSKCRYSSYWTER